MINSNSQKIFCIGLIAILISMALALFGYEAYPPPPGNSVLYIPAAVNFAKGAGLISEVSHDAEIIDTTGNHRFLALPPFFPVFLGFLMPFSTSQGAFIALAWMEIAVIIFSAILLYKTATYKGRECTWFETILISLALLAIATPFQSLSSRSDLLFQWLILGGVFAVYGFRDSKFLWLILSALLGIAAATHPMYIVFLLTLVGMYITARHPMGHAFKELVKTFGTGFLIFWFLMVATPLGAIEKMKGVIEHSRWYARSGFFWFGPNVNQDTPSEYFNDFMSRFFTNPVSFLSGIFLLLFIVCGVKLYAVHRKNIQSPFFFGVFAAFFAFAILMVIARPVTVYYFQMLSPLACAAILWATRNFKTRRVWQVATCFVWFAVSVGFLRQIALFPFFLKDGVSLERARAAYEEIKPEACAYRCMGLASSGLWPLSEEYKAMVTATEIERSAGKRLEEVAPIILLQQNYSGLTTPPDKIDGCTLEKNMFVEKQPKLFGIKLANTMPGYGFAAYQCGKK